MTATQVLGFLGILLIIGFLSDYLFKKTSFPDIIILLILGYCIGPVFHIINPADMAKASQIISSLALATILFNGGLDITFSTIKKSAPRAILLVILGIVLSMAATAAVAHYLLGWELMPGLLLGAMVGGNSPSIVIPLMNRVKINRTVSSSLSIESAFNGALVIVFALIILKLVVNGDGENIAAEAGKVIGLRIAIGGAIGVAAGIFWLWILALLEGETYDDILTLAVVLLLYFATESVQGSGVIFAFIFGLVLGNGVILARWLHIKRTVEVHDLMRKFHAQISFLIKTFFFIYLGLMATFDKPAIIVLGVVLSLVLLLARYFAVLLSSIGNKAMQNNVYILTAMYPRGLSAAVVAQIIIVSDIQDASTYSDITTIIIVATIIISAIGILLFRKRPQEKSKHQVEEQVE